MQSTNSVSCVYNMYIYNMQIICVTLLCSKWLIHLTVSKITLANLKIRLSVPKSSDFNNSQNSQTL